MQRSAVIASSPASHRVTPLSPHGTPRALGEAIVAAAASNDPDAYGVLFPTFLECLDALPRYARDPYLRGPRSARWVDTAFGWLRDRLAGPPVARVARIEVGQHRLVQRGDGTVMPVIEGSVAHLTDGRSVDLGSFVRVRAGWRLFVPAEPARSLS